MDCLTALVVITIVGIIGEVIIRVAGFRARCPEVADEEGSIAGKREGGSGNQ